MAAAAISKNKNCDISATVWPIATKFGTVTYFDPLNRSNRYKFDFFFKIQDGVGHLPEKKQQKSARNLAHICKLTLQRSPTLKISNFQKSKMADGRQLKRKQKWPHRYFSNVLTDRRNIWQNDKYWPTKSDRQLKFRTVNNSRWWTAAILKKIEKCSTNGHY